MSSPTRPVRQAPSRARRNRALPRRVDLLALKARAYSAVGDRAYESLSVDTDLTEQPGEGDVDADGVEAGRHCPAAPRPDRRHAPVIEKTQGTEDALECGTVAG